MNFQGLFAGGAAFSPFLLEQRSSVRWAHFKIYILLWKSSMLKVKISLIFIFTSVDNYIKLSINTK